MSFEAQRVYLTNKMKLRAGEIKGLGDTALPIAYPNLPFDIPANAPYGEFGTVNAAKPIPIGGEGFGKVRTRHVGFVQLTIWVPQNKGTKIATVGGDVMESIFQYKRGRDTSGSTYKFGTMESLSQKTKAGWECYVFRVSFEKDTVSRIENG